MDATAKQIEQELFKVADAEKAKVLQVFFKTGKGEYGQGDKFIGVVVPKQRAIVKNFTCMSLPEIDILLQSKYHECRLTALLFLVNMFNKTKEEKTKREIYKFYILRTKYINNWDLVDLTARDIVGGWLFNKSRKLLYKFSQSKNIWQQRISIISTFYFIARGDFADTLKISSILLNHKHDLIHKAVGWMLREIGKRDFKVEYNYLTENQRYKQMPRTMLRYAIEKFPENLRISFLAGDV